MKPIVGRSVVEERCLVSESILGEGERIPADWPISGTTGYEFIAALSDALVDNAGATQLRALYQDTVGRRIDMGAELRAGRGFGRYKPRFVGLGSGPAA